MGWGDSEVDGLVAALCDEVADDLFVVERALQAIVREVPSYAEVQAGDLEDVRAGLRQGIKLCLGCLVAARPPDGAELHDLWLVGAQRARQGIPAEDLLRVLEMARRMLLDALLSRPEAGEVPAAVALEAARTLAGRLDRFTDVVRVVLLEGHAHGLEEWFPEGSRRRAVLVDRLLESRWTSEADLADDARAIGRVLGPRCGLLLVVPLDKVERDGLLRAAAAVAAVVSEGIEGALRWSPTAHVPVVASPSDAVDWERQLRSVEEAATFHEVGVVVIEPATSASELVDAYRQAVPSLARASVARRGPGIIRLRRLRLLRVLAGEASVSERMAFVRDVLGPVLALPDAEAMLEILDACHVGSGRLADVARSVHRHENTVRKRLDRIEALTGLSTHVPAERYELDTAVHLHKILVQDLQSLDHRQ